MPLPPFIEDPTLSEAVQASKCYNCLPESEKDAIILWLMAQCVKNLDDEDYTNINDLSKAVACWACAPNQTLHSFVLLTFYQLAVAIGAIDEMSVSQLRDQAKCWVCADRKIVKAAFPFLLHHLVEAALPEPPD